MKIIFRQMLHSDGTASKNNKIIIIKYTDLFGALFPLLELYNPTTLNLSHITSKYLTVVSLLHNCQRTKIFDKDF
jgi:hypothetical protein